MAKRYFNWKLAIVLVIAFSVLAVAAFGLRQWRRINRVENALEIGIKAYEEHRWEQAAKYLGIYLAVESGDVPILLKYADAQYNIRPLKRNNIQQAINAYRIILREDKNNSEAAMQLATIYLGMGMPGEAELITRRVPNINQDPELHRMLALSLAAQRKFTEAAIELKNIIKEHPQHISAYETLGQLTMQRPKDFSQSPDYWFNEAVKNNPSSALAYIVRADFHIANKDRISALADLEQAQKQDLSDHQVRLRLANLFINANLLDEAEEHLTVVQSLEPTSQTLWQIWAQLALKSGSKEKMLKVAETGLKELSSQPWDFMPKATELYIRANKPALAAECILKMNQKDISPPTVAFLEGLVADLQGHGYEAIKCLRRATQLGNKSQGVRLALASVLSRLGDTQSALRELNTLVKEKPNSFEGHLALAKLLARTGNWAQAGYQARRAIQISPENFESNLLYLQARLQLLAQNQTDKDSPTWQVFENNLAALEKASDNSLPVGILQLRLAIQRSQFDKANQLLSELKQTYSSQINVAMSEVELLVAQNKMDEAISILNTAVENFPEALEPVKYLALLSARRGDREKCETIIKETLARIENPVATRELGLLLVESYSWWKEEENAYKLLSGLAQKLPDDIPVKRRLLGSKPIIENSEETQKIVNEIKSLEGEDGWQWRYEQAKVWFGSDDFKDRHTQVISLLKENLQTNPDDQASRRLLAATYERAGELQLAISTYRDALNRSPQDLRIIIPFVTTLYKAGEYVQADKILNLASRQKLYHPQLQKLRLQSYIRRGQLSSASDILEDLVDTDPNNHEVVLSLALLKMQQDKFAEAGELLAKLKIQAPDLLPVTVAQVQLNIRQDNVEEALRLCNEIINNLNNAAAYILRARMFSSLGQIDRAVEDFEHAIAIEPNNVNTWVVRSDFYRSTGQLDKATADIQQALSLVPASVQIQERTISLFLTPGNTESVQQQGRTILDKALEANPEHIGLRLLKAQTLLTEGTAPAIENAISILRNINIEQPANTRAWLLLGQTFLSKGESEKALDIALWGLSHQPDNKSLLLLKAQAEAIRFPALAIPTLKSLRERYPDDSELLVSLAKTYIAAGQPQKAVNLLKEQSASYSLDGTPEERRVYIVLAVALYKNGDKKTSQDIFDSLYQSAPDDPSPLFAQVSLLKDDELWGELSRKTLDWCQNHPEDIDTPLYMTNYLAVDSSNQAKKIAEDLLRGSLQGNPDSIPVLNALAMLLQMTEQSNEAALLYKRLLELDPDNVIAMNNLAWILCQEQGQYQQALEFAQRGLRISPNYIDLIDTCGVVYSRLGQYEEAIQNFTRCLELYSDRTPAKVASYLHLGRALAKIGRKDEAVEKLKKTLELNTEIGGLTSIERDEAQNLVNELLQGT